MNDPALIAQGLKNRIVRLVARHGHRWDDIRDHLIELHKWLIEAEAKKGDA